MPALQRNPLLAAGLFIKMPLYVAPLLSGLCPAAISYAYKRDLPIEA
jgi:hypothetical protein